MWERASWGPSDGLSPIEKHGKEGDAASRAETETGISHNINIFILLNVKYHEIPPIILSGVLGMLTAFIAYGRMVISPIF